MTAFATLAASSSNRVSEPVSNDDAITRAVLIGLWGLLTLAVYLRWFGTLFDYLDYVYYYSTIPPRLSFQDSRFEPGFHFSAWFFARVLRLSVDAYLATMAGFALGLKFWLFRKHLHFPILAAIAYFLLFFGLHEYTQIRAAVALSLGYAAIHFLLQSRYVAGVALLGLGTLFHTSLVLLVPAYAVALVIRGNTAVIAVGVVGLTAFYFSDAIYNFAVVYLSQLNPLLQSYLDNSVTDISSLSFTSANNLIYTAAIGSAVACGWMNFGRYHSTFLVMSLMSLVLFALFSASPIVAQRSKEVLMVSSVFLMFRAPLSERTLPPMLLYGATASFLFYLQLQNKLLSF